MTERNPPFENRSCGLGTFLDIANRAILEKCRNGEYTAADIDVLQTNVFMSLYHLGDIAETLGMERIDYMDDPSNTQHQSYGVNAFRAGNTRNGVHAGYHYALCPQTPNRRRADCAR